MFSVREPVVTSTEPNIPEVTGNGYEETGCDTVALSEKDGAGAVRGMARLTATRKSGSRRGQYGQDN